MRRLPTSLRAIPISWTAAKLRALIFSFLPIFFVVVVVVAVVVVVVVVMLLLMLGSIPPIILVIRGLQQDIEKVGGSKLCIPK